jgi:hypothetical protein
MSYAPAAGDSAKELRAAWRKSVPDTFTGTQGAALAQAVLDDLTTTQTAILFSFGMENPLVPYPREHPINLSRARLRKIRDGFAAMPTSIIGKGKGKFRPLLLTEADTMYGFIGQLQVAAGKAKTLGDFFRAAGGIGSWVPLALVAGALLLLDRD